MRRPALPDDRRGTVFRNKALGKRMGPAEATRPKPGAAEHGVDGLFFMHAAREQRTIACPRFVEGFGYWSGQDIRVEFHPADVDHGVVFVRHDVQPEVRIRATVDHRCDMPLRTTLESNGVRVEMVEHILAALAGLEIDNCEVRVSAAEMPGCDGSSRAFVEAIESAGVVRQAAPVRRLVVRHPVRLGDDTAWVEARPHPQGLFSVEYHLDYGPGPIGRQHFRMEVTPEAFRRELASSRTFTRLEEANALRSQGLGERVTARDLLIFDERGPIDNVLRFDDECVRHKVLDLIGDLALSGYALVGHVTAYRSGHRLNAELVRVLVEQHGQRQQHARSA